MSKVKYQSGSLEGALGGGGTCAFKPQEPTKQAPSRELAGTQTDRQYCLALVQLHHMAHGTWAMLNICITKTHGIRHLRLASSRRQIPRRFYYCTLSTIPTPTGPSFSSRCCLHVPLFTLPRHTPPPFLSSSTSPLLKSQPRSGVEAQIPLLPEAVTLLLFPHPIHDTTNAVPISIPNPRREICH